MGLISGSTLVEDRLLAKRERISLIRRRWRGSREVFTIDCSFDNGNRAFWAGDSFCN